MSYVAPKFDLEAFNCPLCGAYAHQFWSLVRRQPFFGGSYTEIEDCRVCICARCKGESLWFKGKMIWPQATPVQPAHPEMPVGIKKDYDEAALVLSAAPRAAAALLRLAVQKLVGELGYNAKNLDSGIAQMVEAGLRKEIQQALDILRVIGNNAVHPGEIVIDDDVQTCSSLFDLMNLIVEDQIAQPKKIAALYGSLPKGALDAIGKRDKGQR